MVFLVSSQDDRTGNQLNFFQSRLGRGFLKCTGPALFVFLALKVANPESAWELIKGLRWEFLLVSLFFFPLLVWIHSVRWWLACRLIGMRSSLKRLFEVYYVGWFLGFLPPGGVAVAAKILYLRRDGQPAGPTAVSLAVDKLFDLLSTGLFGIYGVVYFRGLTLGADGLWLPLGGGILLLLSALALGKYSWEKIRGFVAKRVKKMGAGLAEGVRGSDEALRAFWRGINLRVFLVLLLFSALIDVGRATVFLILGWALGLGMSIPFAFACRAIVGLVQVFPVTIGGLGTREAVLLLTFPAAGLSKEAAIAMGFLSFLWNTAWHLSGVVFWVREPMPGKEVIHQRKTIALPK